MHFHVKTKIVCFMKKILLSMFFMVLMLQIASAQKVIRRSTKEICECLEQQQELLEQSSNRREILTNCVSQVLNNYEQELEEAFGSGDTYDSDEASRRIIERLNDDCPVFAEYFHYDDPAEKSDAERAFDEGEEYLADGNPEAAIEAYSRAISLDDSKPEYYNARGNVYYRSGDAYRAISEYMKATDVDPGYGMAYYNMGYTKYKMGDHKAALADLNHAIERLPEYCEAYNVKGLIWFNLEEADSAYKYFSIAMNCDSSVANYHYNTGYVLYLTKNYEDALRNFFQALNRGREGEKIYSYIGNCYAELENHEQALAYHSKAINSSDSNYIPYYNRSMAYYHLARYDKALQDLEQAWALDTTDADIMIHQALCCEQLDQMTKAEACYAKAIAMEPGYAPYFDARARFYEKAGRHEASIRDSEVSLGIYPDDCAVYQSIGRNYRALGNEQKAAEAFAKALELGCEKTGEVLQDDQE